MTIAKEVTMKILPRFTAQELETIKTALQWYIEDRHECAKSFYDDDENENAAIPAQNILTRASIEGW